MTTDKGDEKTRQLRIIATSDLHFDVDGYDYYLDQPRQAGGLARAAQLIRSAREEAAN